MFPKFILFFIWIAVGLIISSCAMMIDDKNRAPITDISVNGSSSSGTISSSGLYSFPIQGKLQPIKQDLSNKKNNIWISPVSKNAKLVKKFSQNQPRLGFRGYPGSEVFAARDGVVEFSGEVENLGLIIIIKHSNEFTSIYLNNYRNLVEKNQRVRKGHLIAQMGVDPQNQKIGLLNFELRHKNKNTNPSRYF